MVLDGITAAIIAAIGIILLVVIVLRTRSRERRRRELRAEADRAIAVLSTTPEHRGDDEAAATAADVAAQTRLAADALQELERLSRSEIAAAARDLRGQVTTLGQTIEARLRGTGDPYLLDVRATELRERVRGASHRLSAAVGD